MKTTDKGVYFWLGEAIMRVREQLQVEKEYEV
jgi:hypothetical protein